MRVLFDARPGVHCATGIGRYTRTVAELLLAGVAGSDRWTLAGSEASCELRAASPLEQDLALPALLERESVDVFHSPLFHLPALLPCRAIVTIHDAIPARRPDLAVPGFARLFEVAERAARRADAVVCPSRHAKADLVGAIGLEAEKVHVVPETPAPVFRPSPPAAVEALRRRLGLDGPYLLVVGSLERRKNPGLVLDALATLRRSGDAPLVVFVGPEAGFDLRGAADALHVSDRVSELGVVPDADLSTLLTGATALVFPSLYEGFGLPVIEAFACDTAVLASNAASIPEVAGDAALLFDPSDAAALATAIERVVGDAALRDDLRRRGRARLAHFSREIVGGALSALYEQLEGVPA